MSLWEAGFNLPPGVNPGDPHLVGWGDEEELPRLCPECGREVNQLTADGGCPYCGEQLASDTDLDEDFYRER